MYLAKYLLGLMLTCWMTCAYIIYLGYVLMPWQGNICFKDDELSCQFLILETKFCFYTFS